MFTGRIPRAVFSGGIFLSLCSPDRNETLSQVSSVVVWNFCLWELPMVPVLYTCMPFWRTLLTFYKGAFSILYLLEMSEERPQMHERMIKVCTYSTHRWKGEILTLEQILKKPQKGFKASAHGWRKPTDGNQPSRWLPLAMNSPLQRSNLLT